jgi:hypothetical protein
VFAAANISPKHRRSPHTNRHSKGAQPTAVRDGPIFNHSGERQPRSPSPGSTGEGVGG